MTEDNYEHLSTGKPTYCPTDRNKIPDVLDFFVTKNIAQVYMNIKSSLDLSSHHTPVMLTLSTGIICQQRLPSLHNKKTDWTVFIEKIDREINLKIPLKNEQEIEGTEYIMRLIQNSAWATTPKPNDKHIVNNYTIEITSKLTEKSKLRRKWKLSRNPIDKTNFNRCTRELKKTLQRLE